MTSPTATIAHALKGVDFPCSRDTLLDYARRNAGEGGALHLLSSIPERSYGSMSEVFRGLKQARGLDAAELPPEPEDFYDEVTNPPPLAMSAPEPHQTDVMIPPWLWPWDFTIRYWQMICGFQALWWKAPEDD